MLRKLLAIPLLIASSNVLIAQEHAHTPGMTHPDSAVSPSSAGIPVSPGQAAYAAIGEIVRLLEQDSATDWSSVNLERLRQHLIDMDEVTMRSMVQQENIAGGARFTVTGRSDRTTDAIRRMTRAHGSMLGADGLTVTIDEVPAGVRLGVVTARPSDERSVARIRGLGFIGLMTTGDHHGPHHLAMAKGTIPGHGH